MDHLAELKAIQTPWRKLCDKPSKTHDDARRRLKPLRGRLAALCFDAHQSAPERFPEHALVAPTTTDGQSLAGIGRREYFLRLNAEGMTPAPIRDHWNSLSDAERSTIAPGKSHLIPKNNAGRRQVAQQIRDGKKSRQKR